MKILPYKILLLLSFISFAFIPPVDDEGMYPLSEIRNLKDDLKAAGLKIPVDEIYNPEGVSLIDALVKVGGCTGSFVSAEGLILTNHHCTFSQVANASTVENNHLENGFLAESREDEIPAKGLTCRITESYEDVSERILKAAAGTSVITKRIESIQNEIKKIVAEEEEKYKGIKAEVSEMFTGKSYILFRYRTINDIRIVYVPPRAIGEFGGESDNWIWPRHTGDFSFIRAYVAPDGTPASYSENNIPYTPKRHLKVNPEGVTEGDFVFILGYPGRTYRHQPSQFVEYQANYQLPYIQKMYSWLINLYEEKGAENPNFALEISPRIKSLANTEKNYRGKLLGIKRLDLIERKKQEERELQEFINSDEDLKKEYGEVLSDIDDAYRDQFEAGRRQYIYTMLRNVKLYRIAELMIEYHDELNKNNDDRKSLYRDENINTFYNQINTLYNESYPDLDVSTLAKIMEDLQQYPETSDYETFSLNGYKNSRDFTEKTLYGSIVNDPEKFFDLLKDPPSRVRSLNDPLIEFAAKVYSLRKEDEKIDEARKGKLNILLAQYLDVRNKMMKTNFIPDANSTLRLTYGYVLGYSPADATYYSPQTTLTGLVEKGKESGDYKLPQIVRKLYAEKDFGKFIDPKLGTVPVGLLYNMDTTGGNSGSPILNAAGELIGLNFDRAFEATINDYAWSEDYSRSIGVDIRFILWFTQKAGGADFLLEEMGVSNYL